MPIKLNGATSGSVELDVPDAVGSDLQVTLPATAGEIVVKDSSGNVGIGTTSNYDDSVLEVRKASGGDGVAIRVTNDTTTNGSLAGVIFTNSTSDFTSAAIAHKRNDNALIFFNGQTAGGGGFANATERMRIDSSGNVGIGTTSPEYLFDARGSINVSGSIFRRGADNAIFSLTNRAAQPLTFGTNDTERMRINSNGRVDIGDELGIAHAGEFQVINTSGGQQDNDALAFFETNSPDWIMMTNYNAGGTHYHMRFEQQGSVRGSISGSSGAGVTYGGSSDYRLKENVVEITGTQGIDICKKLKPSYFNWINNRVETGETNTVDGFIAHEVQEAGVLAAVIGEKDAVNEDGSIDAQIMDYGKMTPVLSAAIKGLIDKIETLEQRLTDAGL